MLIKVRIACLGVACLLLFVLGCVEISTMYQGNTVTKVPVVALQGGGPHAGTWKTFDLVMDYQYKQNGGVLDISGQFALSEHYRMTYDTVSRIYVYLFFLDKDSRVLETVDFPDTGISRIEDSQSFSRTYKVPAGTTGVSFGYSGVVSEKGSRTSFYELPLKKKSPAKE